MSSGSEVVGAAITAPGRLERHRLEHDQRGEHVVAIGTLIRAAFAPLSPPRLRARERRVGVLDGWPLLVRQVPGERESFAGAFEGDEVRSYRPVLSLERQPGAEAKGVRPGGGNDPVRRRLDPRDDRGVVRAQRKLHLHRDPPPEALDDPHQARRAFASPRHEVDHPHRTLGRLEIGLQHKCPWSVATRAGLHFPGRREKPAAMPRIPQQGREARRGIETREAQPVHRSVTTNESRGLHVTDQAVVLDTQGASPSVTGGHTLTQRATGSPALEPARLRKQRH